MSISRSIMLLKDRRARAVGVFLALVTIVTIAWGLTPHIYRRPPNIFDTPVDGVLSYLGADDFNKLPIEERLRFLQDVVKRFKSMSQTDSALASAFFAGLSGRANEKLVDNARILGKDIFVQGASEFLALSDEKSRNEYIDKWLVKWVRFAEEATGRHSDHTDEQVLDRMSEQARGDLKRGIDIDAAMAQQLVDFWDRDIASVTSPKEQAQIYQFFPAIRKRVLERSK